MVHLIMRFILDCKKVIQKGESLKQMPSFANSPNPIL